MMSFSSAWCDSDAFALERVCETTTCRFQPEHFLLLRRNCGEGVGAIVELYRHNKQETQGLNKNGAGILQRGIDTRQI
jgi:hypothetical protein